MLEKGTMRPLKKVLGAILVIAGIGIITMPDAIVPILCNNKTVFGIILAIAGYFHFISGRQL